MIEIEAYSTLTHLEVLRVVQMRGEAVRVQDGQLQPARQHQQAAREQEHAGACSTKM